MYSPYSHSSSPQQQQYSSYRQQYNQMIPSGQQQQQQQVPTNGLRYNQSHPSTSMPLNQQQTQQQQTPKKVFLIYYSNMCESCKKLLAFISKSAELRQTIHFVCIDKRIKTPEGKIMIILENNGGQQMPLPSSITQVPALINVTLNECQPIFGDQIYKVINYSQQQQITQATTTPTGDPRTKSMTQSAMEPCGFDLFSYGSSSSVVSDTFSFIDQTNMTKGNDGTRNMHYYVSATGDSDNLGQMFQQPQQQQQPQFPDGTPRNIQNALTPQETRIASRGSDLNNEAIQQKRINEMNGYLPKQVL